mmetsp:Transcript_16042/g.22983  ORF Transcript_16042/g.22983 Transcript_16042/m.22983 type:complete len:266 (+) Transcript_16042:1-798(+)
MIDTPKFTPSAIKTVTSLVGSEQKGPDYLFLTHTDDVGDHYKWAQHFKENNHPLKRIFHVKDLEENNWIGDDTLGDAEILLRGESHFVSSEEKDEERFKLYTWNLDGEAVSTTTHLADRNGYKWPVKQEEDDNVGDFLILHTPGHSPGSISLLFRSTQQHEGIESFSLPVNVLFTGDTYAYTTRNGGTMTGFPRYADDSIQQSHTLRELLNISHCWDVIAPGHGHPRDYRRGSVDSKKKENLKEVKRVEMEKALKELLLNGRIKQ